MAGISSLYQSKYHEFSEATKERIRTDLATFYSDPPLGISVSQDENEKSLVHAIIVGPSKTPYQGGFFYFTVIFPVDYPSLEPLVELQTTANDTVRFNTNLYWGKTVITKTMSRFSICGWSEKNTLEDYLIGVQAEMNSTPFFNRPGNGRLRYHNASPTDNRPESSQDSDTFNEVILHETLRVAVCGMMMNEYAFNIPQVLVDSMRIHFVEHFEYYLMAATKRIRLDGEEMKDPYKYNIGKFQYGKILCKLTDIEKMLKKINRF